MNLQSSRTRQELLKDNYTCVVFNYIRFEKLYEDCFSLGKDCNEDGTWKTLVGLYNESTKSTNAIHSTESFAGRVPDDPYTTQRFRCIHVILVYRRVHEWLPSQYNQNEKIKFYKSRSRKFNGCGGPERISFVDFFQNYFPRMKDSPHVRNKYIKIFGEDSVTVMPMPSDAALLSEFYCHALPNANNTCHMIRQLEEKRKRGHGVVGNPSIQFLFKHDRLLANARNLIPEHLKQQRHAATVALEERLALLNLTVRDMPQECLTPEQEDALWNYTWQAEQTAAPMPLSHDELYQNFQESRWKFCSVNVTATLQNETWRNIISSIGTDRDS